MPFGCLLPGGCRSVFEQHTNEWVKNSRGTMRLLTPSLWSGSVVPRWRVGRVWGEYGACAQCAVRGERVCMLNESESPARRCSPVGVGLVRTEFHIVKSKSVAGGCGSMNNRHDFIGHRSTKRGGFCSISSPGCFAVGCDVSEHCLA